MEFEYLKANVFQLLMNLVYALFSLLAGIFAFRFIDKYIFREIDFMQEIKNGNTAAAIISAAIFMFVAFIVGFSMI
ncbi:MAG: DUF350 domain-containing protein [Candidatus Aureabacteria bacterium]|nr:DUF350 domain-containing protein [Candidatus Auribacterota bacterium]